MTLHQPVFLQSQSPDADLTYSAFEMRNYAESLNRRDNGFISERGVLAGTTLGFNVTQRGAGANFSVDIASGRAIITDGDVTNGGPAYVWSDATFNLVTPSPPATGTNLHRVVLQLRNKLENGTWTTYDFTPVLVADTSVGGAGTFPAEPTSAITLAQVSIAAGQANVSNANITDYREQAGPNAAYKAADTNRASNTTMAADPDLQLNNLAANAIYQLMGTVFYTAGSPGGATQGDIKFAWNLTSATVSWTAARMNVSGNETGSFAWGSTDIPSAAGQGVSTLMGVRITGTIDTGNAPASAKFKWAQNTSSTTNTTVKAGSYLRARRLS